MRVPTLFQLDGLAGRAKARATGHFGSLVRVFTRARRVDLQRLEAEVAKIAEGV